MLKAHYEIKTKEEARQLAIDCQRVIIKSNMSYGELNFYQNYFRKFGKKFHLIKEFKENGII